MEKLVSVIIPVYNIEKYLPKCLDSVISQTYDKLQIILVDDGSIDNSGRICDEYSEKDSRITVIHKKNSGSVLARKAGIKIAEGEYIGFVDGDDYIEKDMFQRLYEVIEETDADFVNTGFKKNDGNDMYGADFSRIYTDYHENIAEFYKEHIFFSTSDEYIYPSLCSKLFKKDIIMKAYMDLPNEQSYGEDLMCLCRCVHYSRKIVTLNEAYYHYTIRENSLSHNKGISGFNSEYELHKHMCELFAEFNLLSEIKYDLEKRFALSASQWLSSAFDIDIPQYKFPLIENLKGKKIIIYGAGKVGQDYYSQICRYNDCCVVAWTDRNAENISFDYCDVISIDDIMKIDYDILIIAVLEKNISEKIKNNLISIGIDENKIFWCKPIDAFF